ncbi:MAG: glycosyltransferase [Pseudomonadales bacterium]
MNTTRTALHIIHGYNEPFLSLSNQYSRALQSDGWRVITVYMSGAPDTAIRQKTIADDVCFFNTPDAAMKGLKLGLIQRVRQLVQQHQPQLIIAQRYKPLYLALLGSVGSAIPVIGVAHAFGVLKNFSRRYLLYFFRQRLLLVGVSEAVTNDMRHDDHVLQKQALLNCIDTETLAPHLLPRPAAREKLQLCDDEFVFANVGRLHDDKDQSTLIRAFARIAAATPQAKLLLIGKGKREARYRTLIDELHLQERALLTGPVPDANTLFPAFDCYVSSSDREPFGIVLTEAMLARLPVISTDCGGAPEVLGEHALYFPCGDDQKLAAQMLQVLHDAGEQNQQHGEQLYQRLQQQFSFPPFRERLLAAVSRLVVPR